MEKLKCTSCGGHLDIEENNKYAICKHCGAKYKLDKDLNINIKFDDNAKDIMENELKMVDSFFKRFNRFSIVPAIMIIAFFAIVVFITMGPIRKERFNNQFKYDNGTQSSFFVQSTLDEIIESNNTHKRKVSLVYGDKETTDTREITQIKHELSGIYEVSFVYNSGYIEKIVLEKTK